MGLNQVTGDGGPVCHCGDFSSELEWETECYWRALSRGISHDVSLMVSPDAVERRLTGTRSEAQPARRLLQLHRREMLGPDLSGNERWWESSQTLNVP